MYLLFAWLAKHLYPRRCDVFHIGLIDWRFTRKVCSRRNVIVCGRNGRTTRTFNSSGQTIPTRLSCCAFLKVLVDTVVIVDVNTLLLRLQLATLPIGFCLCWFAIFWRFIQNMIADVCRCHGSFALFVTVAVVAFFVRFYELAWPVPMQSPGRRKNCILLRRQILLFFHFGWFWFSFGWDC